MLEDFLAPARALAQSFRRDAACCVRALPREHPEASGAAHALEGLDRFGSVTAAAPPDEVRTVADAALDAVEHLGRLLGNPRIELAPEDRVVLQVHALEEHVLGVLTLLRVGDTRHLGLLLFPSWLRRERPPLAECIRSLAGPDGQRLRAAQAAERLRFEVRRSLLPSGRGQPVPRAVMQIAEEVAALVGDSCASPAEGGERALRLAVETAVRRLAVRIAGANDLILWTDAAARDRIATCCGAVLLAVQSGPRRTPLVM